MPIYTLENVPITVTWINALNAQQAVAQCAAWNINSAPTLEENRSILKNFVRSLNGENLQHDGSNEANLQSPAPNAEQPVTTNSETSPTAVVTTITETSPPTATMTTTTFTTTTPLTTATTSTNTLHSPSPILDPNIQALIQSLQTMTLNAVAQTANTFTEQFKVIQTPSQTQTENFNCPPYVTELLKELPRISGADTRELVTFLKKLHQIIQLNLVKDRYIIMNIMPYTSNRFREFWMTAIAQNLSWPQTLHSIRENFFTSDTLRDLQNQNLYRRQHQREHLADYVKDIQTLHTILSPSTPEQEIFQTIFRGINQQTRTTFAGLKPITSIQDLLDVAPLSASLLDQSTQNQPRDQQPSTSRPQYHSNYQFRPNRGNFSNNFPHRQPHWQTNYPQQYHQTQQFPNHYQFNSQPPNFRPQYQPPSNPSRGFNTYPRNTNFNRQPNRENQPPSSDSKRNLNSTRGGH